MRSIAEALLPRLEALSSPLDVPFAFASEMEQCRADEDRALMPRFAAYAQRFVWLSAEDPLASAINRGIARDQLLGALAAYGASEEEQLIARALVSAGSLEDFARRYRLLLPTTPSLVPLEPERAPRWPTQVGWAATGLLTFALFLVSCAR